MNNIIDDLKDLVEQHLPAVTAGAMKKFIADAENMASEIVRLDEVLDEKISIIKDLDSAAKLARTMIEAHDNITARTEEVTGRELELEKRERNIKLEIAEVNLHAANTRLNTVERLVEKVFGHPSVTVSTTKDIVTPIAGGTGGSCGFGQKDNVNENTTTTEGKI